MKDYPFLLLILGSPLILSISFYEWIKDQCKKDKDRFCWKCKKYIRKRDRAEISGIHKKCLEKVMSEMLSNVLENLRKCFIEFIKRMGGAADAIKKFNEGWNKIDKEES